jgi:single-strand DNA-binding protein
VNLSVASNRQKKDTRGEKVSLADWYRVSLFGRNAEIVAEYARKGSALAFNGRLQIDSYTDREGVERTSICLVADCFEFVPGARRANDGDDEGEIEEAKEAPKGKSGAGKSRKAPKGGAKPEEDDIPF